MGLVFITLLRSSLIVVSCRRGGKAERGSQATVGLRLEVGVAEQTFDERFREAELDALHSSNTTSAARVTFVHTFLFFHPFAALLLPVWRKMLSRLLPMSWFVDSPEKRAFVCRRDPRQRSGTDAPRTLPVHLPTLPVPSMHDCHSHAITPALSDEIIENTSSP